MARFIKAATVDEIPEGTGKSVDLDGTLIGLFNIGGEFYAIDNICTHRGGPLGDGSLEGHEVICPWHGAVFNVKTGAVVGPPAGSDVTCYRVRVSGSDIEVEV